MVVPLLKIVNFAAPAGTTVELLAGKRMSAIVGENTFQKKSHVSILKDFFSKPNLKYRQIHMAKHQPTHVIQFYEIFIHCATQQKMTFA